MKFLTNKPVKIKVLAICLSLIFAITLMFIYQSSKNNFKVPNSFFSKEPSIDSYFETYTENFNSINSSFEKCIINTSIDISTTAITLKDNIDSLSILKAKISSLNIQNNENPEIIPMYISAINATSDLYTYCYNLNTFDQSILQNDFPNKLIQLQTTCNNSYDELAKYNIHLYFSDNTLNFFEIFYGHINSYNKLLKVNSVKELQNSDFMGAYNVALIDFSQLLENLEPALSQIRSDGRSLNILLDDLNSKEDAFLVIKTTFNNNSIPLDCISYYNSLNNIFSLYTTYLSTMKTAVVYEQSSSSYEKNKKQIDSMYENAFSKYTDVSTALSSLLKN